MKKLLILSTFLMSFFLCHSQVIQPPTGTGGVNSLHWFKGMIQADKGILIPQSDTNGFYSYRPSFVVNSLDSNFYYWNGDYYTRLSKLGESVIPLQGILDVGYTATQNFSLSAPMGGGQFSTLPIRGRQGINIAGQGQAVSLYGESGGLYLDAGARFYLSALNTSGFKVLGNNTDVTGLIELSSDNTGIIINSFDKNLSLVNNNASVILDTTKMVISSSSGVIQAGDTLLMYAGNVLRAYANKNIIDGGNIIITNNMASAPDLNKSNVILNNVHRFYIEHDGSNYIKVDSAGIKIITNDSIVTGSLNNYLTIRNEGMALNLGSGRGYFGDTTKFLSSDQSGNLIWKVPDANLPFLDELVSNGYNYATPVNPYDGFYTRGGYASNTQIITENSAVLTTVEHVIRFGNSQQNITLILPDPSDFIDRIITISNNNEGTGDILFSTFLPHISSSQTITEIKPMRTMGTPEPVCFITIKSDGVRWIVVNK